MDKVLPGLTPKKPVSERFRGQIFDLSLPIVQADRSSSVDSTAFTDKHLGPATGLVTIVPAAGVLV